jgi:hypothetical protein
MELINTTPYCAERVVLQNKEGRDLLVVVVKGTFVLADRERVLPAEEQTPIQLADTFHGKPGESSVRYESDLAPCKPNTDVVLLGHAHAARGRVNQLDVSLSVGALKHTIRVFGHRHWEQGFLSEKISAAQPFEMLPLRYEYAFGGKDLTPAQASRHEHEARNPVGVGFRARKSRRAIEGDPLPNLEDPAALIKNPDDRPAPAGFGFFGRHWQPRLAYAGTMDQNWADQRLPLPPQDFDERYFNGAHPSLVYRGFLRGDEPVRVANAAPSGLLRFSLPGECPGVRVLASTGETVPAMRLDTLVIEPDDGRVIVVWRGSMDVHGSLHKVRRISVG